MAPDTSWMNKVLSYCRIIRNLGWHGVVLVRGTRVMGVGALFDMSVPTPDNNNRRLVD